MQITAKFSSTCPKCGQYISVGTRVEWSGGARAVHVSCPTASAPERAPAKTTPKPPPAKKEPSIVEAPYASGEKWEPCKRTHLADLTGNVLVAKETKRGWARLRDGAEGAPVVAGTAFVVVGQTSYYESAEQNEDMGDMSGAGWHVTLYLRHATAEEAAPALEKAATAQAKKAAVELRKAQIKELQTLCEAGWRSFDNDAQCPAGSTVELDPGMHGSGRKIAVASEDGLGVAVWCGGYYDDYRWSLHVSRDPRAVALFVALFETVS